ncbi:MAG: C_GCAxxG_C_C family protein [Candidatus Atribacteria bacterium]|nr:C_GCAxxG_C_C family protein [Candidatus Atribacteria bacterium]MCD6350152.1 C_GCAxxG_C_C family protein [Candidatus Atribacteria bacterium]
MKSAGDFHNLGFNCCESVLLGASEFLGVKSELIPKIATGFGGGIGHTGRICGAVTGAVMALGIKYGRTSSQDKHTRDQLYLKTENFLKDVEKELGSLNCIDLIGVALNTEEGLREYRERNLKNKCHKIIEKVEEILKAYLKE